MFKGIQKTIFEKLFRKVKYSSRNGFLKFPTKFYSEEIFSSERRENALVESAEQIFQETFSEVF